jgi:hypothetical protein
MIKWFVIFLMGCIVLAFTAREYSPGDKPIYIPASMQRSGNASKGYEYLVTGDYLKSGLPIDYFQLGIGAGTDPFLKRKGINADIPYDFTAVKAPNGEWVVAPNCLQCHAQVFEGKLYIGLGNSTIDFTSNQKLDPAKAALVEAMLQKTDLKKFEAAEPFIKVAKAIGDQLNTRVRGVNAADRLAALLAAHRDPQTFRWRDQPSLDIPSQVVPSDVPAWWMLKKKHAMFYNGYGRGDFGRFLMASNLLTVNDSSESREVDSHFNDVLAYLDSLQAPPFPRPIDAGLAGKGAILFDEHCARCHGHYGSGGDYPNLLIPESLVQTDSLLFRSNYQNAQFVDWFNRSWFSQGDHPARLEPNAGYIAPPLDGIWITAPYFHNGSVPNLEEVLNSRTRPKRWKRDFDRPVYDYRRVGWTYTIPDSGSGTDIYDTSLPGYGNYGHRFGDRLSEQQRKALLEYLKTL